MFAGQWFSSNFDIYESFFRDWEGHYILWKTLCSGMAEVDKFLFWAGQVWILGLTLNFVVLVSHQLFVPDGRDSTHYQLVIGTHSGAIRNCYESLFGSRRENKAPDDFHISAACKQMYHDLEVAQKAGPEGRIGLVTGMSHGHNNLVIPARSQKFVSGTVRNRSGRTVTVLIDEVNPHRLSSGVIP